MVYKMILIRTVLITVFIVFTSLTIISLMITNWHIIPLLRKKVHIVDNMFIENDTEVNNGTEFESLKLGVVYPGEKWGSNSKNRRQGFVWSTHFAVGKDGDPLQFNNSEVNTEKNDSQITSKITCNNSLCNATTQTNVENIQNMASLITDKENKLIVGNINKVREYQKSLVIPILEENDKLTKSDCSTLGIAGSYTNTHTREHENETLENKATSKRHKSSNKNHSKMHPTISIFPDVSENNKREMYKKKTLQNPNATHGQKKASKVRKKTETK